MRRKQYGTCVLVIWEECMRESLIDEKDVLEVIRSKYDELFPAERKTADYVLSHADETVLSNVSELARASGVSDATIIRLAHHRVLPVQTCAFERPWKEAAAGCGRRGGRRTGRRKCRTGKYAGADVRAICQPDYKGRTRA